MMVFCQTSNIMARNENEEGSTSWYYCFNQSMLQQEFYEFMKMRSLSYMALLISGLFVGFCFPSNILLLIQNERSDVVIGIILWILILNSFLAGVVGSFHCFFSYYYAQSSDSYYKVVPSLQTIFIIAINIHNLLCVYNISFDKPLCDNSVWYCPGVSGNSSFCTSLYVVPLTPLVLVYALREIRLFFIFGCQLAVIISAIIFALITGSFDLAVHLLVSSLIACVIVVDIHTSRQEKFLFHRNLTKALGTITKLEDLQRDNDSRQIVGLVAHELKTPLSSISSALEMIMHSTAELDNKIATLIHDYALFEATPSIQSIMTDLDFTNESVKGAQNALHFMLTSIQRFMEFSKSIHGVRLMPHNESCQLTQVVLQPIQCMQSMQSKLDIVLRPIPLDICNYIITDKRWFEENLLCFLSNAVKYTTEGMVGITLRLCLEKELCSIKTSVEDEMIHVFSPTSSSRDVNSVAFPAVMKKNYFNQQGKSEKYRNKVIPLLSQQLLSTIYSIDEQNLNPPDDTPFLCVEVEDSGIGVSDERLPTLFCPFQQTPQLTGGSGLGLYSLAKRVEAMKGYYGMKKRENHQEGSLFWFAIPYRPDIEMAQFDFDACKLNLSSSSSSQSFSDSEHMDAHTNLRKASFSHSKDLPTSNNSREVHIKTPSLGVNKPANTIPITFYHRKRILIVDDSPVIVRIMTMMFTRYDCDVTSVSNGASAIELIKQSWCNHYAYSSCMFDCSEKEEYYQTISRGYDLIFMDIHMPIMDGIEATKRIRNLEMNIHQPSEHQIDPSHGAPESNERKSLVILGMSANDDVETKQVSIAAGMTEFITKPISIDKYLELLRKY